MSKIFFYLLICKLLIYMRIFFDFFIWDYFYVLLLAGDVALYGTSDRAI